MKKHLLMLMVAVMATAMSLNARTVVIDEGFENGIQEDAWTQEYVYGEMAWAVEGEEDNLAYPSSVHEGTHRAFLRNPSSETLGYKTRLVSKVMDLRPNKVYMPELTFWYANPKWGADCDTLRVMYRTGSRAEWKQLAEYSTSVSSWQRVKIVLPEVGQTYQIAFEGTDNLGHGIVLDEIKLQSAPECTIPYDLMVTNKGAGKVNLAWSASFDADNFEVIVARDTIEPEMIAEVETLTPEKIAFHGLVSGEVNNYDLTLEAGEFYLAYVRSICEDENSAWSSEASKDGPFGFRVRVAKQVPFTEKFNYASGVRRDPEWSWGSNTGKTNPFVNSTTSGKARANYSPDTTAALIFSGGDFTSLTEVIPADRYAYVATPALADTTNDDFKINQCQVHFWSTVYTNTGRKFGRSLMVGVMDDPDDITTFTPIDTVTVWGNMSFVENIVDLGSYQGNGVFLAFVSDFDRDNLFYIDNLTVEYRKEVNKVTEISVNPRDTYATITWKGNAASYNVLVTNAEVNPNNPAASAIVDQTTVGGNSYVCEALEADHSWNRPYYVYVQAEGQEWSYRYPFVTVAAQRAIPYSYDFEALNTPTYQIGTKSYATGIGVFGNSGNYPAIENNSAKSYVGSGCLSMSMMGGKDGWITLPMVEDLSNTQVKFYLSGYQTYDQAHATVGVMSNPMDINTFIPVADFQLNTTGYTRCYANFENYSGPEGVIAIVWADVMNMSKFTNNYIDNLTVEELSECVPPTNIELLSIEPDSITVTWESSELSDEWELFISRVAWKESDRVQKSFDQMTTMPGFVLGDTLTWPDDSQSQPQFGIGGLAEHTNYYMYVRATCDQDWWTEVAFSTPCEEKVFPWKETFEAYSSGSTDAGCWQLKDYVGVDYPKIYSTSNNKWLELYSSGTTHRSMAILPTVEGTLTDQLLTFDVRNYSTSSSASGVVYIGTMEDISNQTTFVPFDTVKVTGSDVKKVRVILSNYELAYGNLAITSGIGTLQMNSDVLIDNVELKDPSCIDAYDFKQINLAPHSIDLTWSGVSNNDQWRVKVLNQNATVAAVKNGTYNSSYDVLDTTITGKNIHIEDLESSKMYYIYVQTLCADSIWAGTSAKTTCELLDPAKANKETFESYSEGAVPGCWTVGNSSSYGRLPYVTSHGGSQILYLYQSSNTAWAASPEILIDSLYKVMVTFSSGASTSSEYCVLGVMTDPDDLNTFVALDSVKGEGSSAALQTRSFDLSDYKALIPPTAKYIAWRGRKGKSDWVYLDDVSIISMACPMPKTSISELTTRSVRVSSGLTAGDQWILWVTNHSLTESHLNNETAVQANWIIAHDTTDRASIKVTGLQGQTRYYIYAASLCEDSVISQWKSSYFVTPCEAMVPETMGVITFSEEEGFTTGSNGEMPCWIKGSKTEDVSNSYIPYVEDNASTKHNGNNYLKFYDYVSGTTTQNIGAYAIMPTLDVDSISKYQVNFWGRSYNSSSYNNQIIVGVITDPSDLNTFVPMDTLNLSRTSWDPYSVGFESYEGDYMGDLGTNIMFISDFGVTNYAYISEISVELIPHCRAISSFSVDSVGENAAKVSWKGYQDTYRLLLADKALLDADKPNYKYLLDTIVDHSDEVLITGLHAASTYYAYAQGICDGGDSTAISMVYATIRTTCPTEGGAALPFYDDFESYELDDQAPGCWQLLTVGSHSSWFAVKTVSSNASKAIDVYSSGGSGCYMIVPKVDGNLENLQLSFDARQYSGSAARFYVGVMEDVNDVSTFVQLEVFDLEASTNFTHCVMNLADYEMPYDNLVLTAGISGITTNSYDVYIDNVGLEMLATCNSPKLKSIGATAHSVEVSLTPASKQDSQWQMAVIPESIYSTLGAAALANYLEQMDKIDLDTTYVQIDNLDPATSYYIFARTVCGENEVSAWTRNPLKVTTRFYYEDSYHFGFEKNGELWQRSQYSQSDNYFIHPALITGRAEDGQTIESMMYYPYSLLSSTTELYSREGDGAMLMYSDNGIYGEYVIFPSVGKAQERSFEFQVRQSAIDATTKLPKNIFNAVFEIGTVDKDQSFDTYQTLATVRMDKLNPGTKATTKASNNMLFTKIALDLDSATIADKQIVLYLPKQPADTAYLYFDEVKLDAPKDFSLVALKKVVADGTTALVEWYNVGKKWNLKITTANGTQVAQYPNLSGVTSQLVENLDPNTTYIATLELADAPSAAQYYRKSDKLSFRTLCEAIEPDENQAFVWDFDNSDEYEPNDVLAGDAHDSLYLKPSCFQTGISYMHSVNGYQWLIQRNGYETSGAMTAYNGNRHQEAGLNGSNALRVHTTDANYNAYIVLPKLNCRLDTMMIEFYGRCFTNYDDTYTTASARGRIVDATYLGSAYSQSMVVGSLSDPMDWNTLHIIDTLHYANTQLTTNNNVNDDPAGLDYWELMQLPLDSVQGEYIVLFQPAPGLFFVDNLAVKPIGNTLFKPTNAHTSDITATTAALDWNVRRPNVESVVVLLNGQGQEVFRDTVSGTHCDLTNLTPAAMYEWYVYQTDGTNDSPATKAVGFYTDCVTNNADYTCGFEDIEGWKFIDGQTNYKQTLCWTYGDAIQNEWKSATYDPYNQSNTKDYAYSFEGNNAVPMRASYSSRISYQPYIATPAMDINTYDTLQVMFWMRPAYVSATNDSVITSYTGSTYSKSIIVGTMTDPTDATTFVPIDTVTYDGTLSIVDKATEANNRLYQQMKVELAGATGPYVALMTSFQAKGGGSQKSGDYVWIDNISFEHRQECKDPTDLEAIQIGTFHAMLHWNGIDSAGSYLLQVSTDPYFADEDAFVFNEEVRSNTYKVEGLQPLTSYVWRVQALCGERWGESSFSQKATFKTSRSPYFYEPFDAAVNANEWTFSKAHADNVIDTTGVVASGLDSWSFTRTANGYGLTGSHYQAIGYSGDYHWMISPIFYLPEEDSVHFSMDLALTACNTAHAATNNAVTENDMKDDYYFMIIVSEDGGKTWKSNNILSKWQNTNVSGEQLRDIPATGMTVRYSLASYAGKNIRIGLYREAKTTSNTGIAVHVDNFRLAYFEKTVDYASACQYEDIQVGDIYLSGEDTKPGIHAYPTCYYVSDADAQAGKRDSVQQLEIEIFPAQETFFADTICEGETYTGYDFLAKDRTGTYRRKLHTVEHGCDSIVTLYLYVKERRYGEDTEVELCAGTTITWQDKEYNRAGIYRDTLTSSIGCDSILTLVITNSKAKVMTFRDSTVIERKQLPFTYVSLEHPYAAGQEPIFYDEGTPVGTYIDTVYVDGIEGMCPNILIHKLTITNNQAIDNVDASTPGARKLIYRDQLYIILDDEWYNASGMKVADPTK